MQLINMLLSNEWVNQEIKQEIKKYMNINENENTVVQNLWDTVRGKFTAIQAYLRK